MAHMTVILAIRRLRQEDGESKASRVRKETGRKGEREGKPGIVGHSCDPSVWEVEAGGSYIFHQGHHQLQVILWLGYMRPRKERWK